MTDAQHPQLRALQQELSAATAAAQALAGDLMGVKVTSPFNARVRYNLYAAFRIITAHERRHLWQAERALPPGVAGP